jgi:hypothetical protein
VVLWHQMPVGAPRATHWDFMIEVGSALRTWALAEEPSDSATIDATALPDHRLAYLEYEGPVSGDRGEVSQWDRGVCRAIEVTADRCLYELAGDRLVGQVLLVRVQPTDHWTFRFSSGRLATPE